MKNQIDRLNSLIQLDYDAVLAYSQAIDNVELDEVKDKFSGFKADHERHIQELSSEVRTLGGIPHERARDLKGFFIEGFTAIRSMTGTAGALKAMRMNELLTNRNYQRTMKEAFPDRTKRILERNFQDEQRHIKYIEQAIEAKIWESETRKAG
ncbi:MAG: ferritin-like domain-containing protein [Deltaproteobacteria bacterium]|nr:ferritin-like domain-containing protein [Deltaproteobacteria bacterium]